MERRLDFEKRSSSFLIYQWAETSPRRPVPAESPTGAGQIPTEGRIEAA